MNDASRNRIQEYLKSSEALSIIEAADFYFQYAKDTLDRFLNLEVGEELKVFLLANKKEYNELKHLFDQSEEFLEFGRILLTLVSYCDAKAYRKNELNQYHDKRVLALASVRMTNWVEQLITYKFKGVLPAGSIKNAIEYLLDPLNHFTMLSENHRNQISENWFGKSYDEQSFRDDFFKYFEELSLSVQNPQNYTHLLTRVSYELSQEWKESIIGLICPDATGWQDEAIEELQDADYIVLWNHKKPNGTDRTLRLLRDCIEENGFFRVFYTSGYKVRYVAEIVDFVTSQQELNQSKWESVSGNLAWYHSDFASYKDQGGKSARWIYLARRVSEANPDDYTHFKYFGSFDYPSVGCQAPVISYSSMNEINSKKIMQEVVDLLLYKKQIILQGPPGTGKTRMAKEIAAQLTGATRLTTLSEAVIKEYCNHVSNIPTAKTKLTFKILGVNDSGVRVENSEGREYTAPYNEIIRMYEGRAWEKEGMIINGTHSYSAAVAKFLHNKQGQFSELPTIAYSKIIQFHPSYTYEDFVRGIVAETKGDRIEYKSVNKILGEFAAEALKSFKKSKQGSEQISKEFWLEEQYLMFKEYLEGQLEESSEVLIKAGKKPKIKAVELDSIRVNRYSDEQDSVLIKDSDIINGFIGLHVSNPAIKIKDNVALSKSARSGMYYLYQNLVEKFKEFLEINKRSYDFSKIGEVDGKEQNFVLIIDEINRANLSSVFGELIYALEYRGKEVDTMYEVGGSNKLVLPPNLYIIGTMNTADRSVGHIDYAMRRRFAFVDVPSQELEDNEEIYFNNEGYRKVENLFKTNLSPEFEEKDVKIGHSYFIADRREVTAEQKDQVFRLKMQYEVVPILTEYVKDGVLIDTIDGMSVKDYIEGLILNK